MSWQIDDVTQVSTAGAVTASTSGATTITASGTINTKGSWSELTAATPHDAYAAMVQMQHGGFSNRDALLDIGIGGSGSEVVLIPNILTCSGVAANNVGTGMPPVFPVAIPAGSRLSARIQSTVASYTRRVSLVLFAATLGSAQQYARVTDYGATTADSGATSIDAGGTANTKGSWTQITAATTAPVRQLVIAIGHQQQSARGTAQSLIDIGVGGSGSEQVIVPNILVESSTLSRQPIPAFAGPLPISIPAGTRLAARCQCSSNAGATRVFDIALYGID